MAKMIPMIQWIGLGEAFERFQWVSRHARPTEQTNQDRKCERDGHEDDRQKKQSPQRIDADGTKTTRKLGPSGLAAMTNPKGIKEHPGEVQHAEQKYRRQQPAWDSKQPVRAHQFRNRTRCNQRRQANEHVTPLPGHFTEIRTPPQVGWRLRRSRGQFFDGFERFSRLFSDDGCASS